MSSYDSSQTIAELQRALVKYEQSLLGIANGVDQHGAAHKPSKNECDAIVSDIKTMISRARRSTSVGVEVFTTISSELTSRETEIQHMEARIEINKKLLSRAKVENTSIKILTTKLSEQM